MKKKERTVLINLLESGKGLISVYVVNPWPDEAFKINDGFNALLDTAMVFIEDSKAREVMILIKNTTRNACRLSEYPDTPDSKTAKDKAVNDLCNHIEKLKAQIEKA